MKELMNISSGLANSELFKSLQDTTDKIAGGGGEYKRISLKGGKFRLVIGGEQVGKPRTDAMSLVIIDAAELSRTYYEGNYDSDNPTPPSCWSSDSKKPDEAVPEDQRQSATCKDCPMAIKGSGQGQTAACRFSQRLAVALDNELDKDEVPVYQLSLPAKSVFGAAENGHMPMHAYGKMLKAHKAPVIAVVTEMYFDEDSDTPKVFFKPNRMLTEDELKRVVELRSSEEVKDALTMTVSETDGTAKAQKSAALPAKEKPAKKPTKKPAKKAEPEEDEEEPIEEPTKVKKSKSEKPAIEVDDELAGLIDDWDE